MTPATAIAFEPDPGAAPGSVITLLDLVRELGKAGVTDREVVAAVMDVVETDRVRLSGQIGDPHLLSLTRRRRDKPRRHRIPGVRGPATSSIRGGDLREAGRLVDRHARRVVSAAA